MAPPTLSPLKARRLPIITESPPASPGKRSFFSFRRQSLPPASPPIIQTPPIPRDLPSSSSIPVASPAASITSDDPSPIGSHPRSALPSPRPDSEVDPDVRLPRSSGTFGFTDRPHASQEDMFERLGSGGPAMVESPSGGATPIEPDESDFEEAMEVLQPADPRVVVQVQELSQDSEIPDSPFELEFGGGRQRQLRTEDSVESLLDQPPTRGGTFGTNRSTSDPTQFLTPQRTASQLADGPPLIPLLSPTTPTAPPTSYPARPHTLAHQSSNLTIFHTPHSSPSVTASVLEDLGASSPSPEIPVVSLPVPVPIVEEAGRTAIDLGSSAGDNRASSDDGGKIGGSWKAESEGGLPAGGEKMRRGSASPEVPLLTPLPSTTNTDSSTLLQHHRTRLTSLAQTLQLESRRLSQSRERLESINVELARELEAMVAELGRVEGGRRERTGSHPSMPPPKEGKGREEDAEGMRTDDEGGPAVRRQPSGNGPKGGSPLKRAVTATPAGTKRVEPVKMEDGPSESKKGKKEKERARKGKSWGERLFGPRR